MAQILIEKLRSANTFPLTVLDLNKAGDLYGRGFLEATFWVPGGAHLDQIKDIIERAGYQRPAQLIEDKTLFLKVTEGDSAFDATEPQGLQISQDEPLLWWMDRYNEYHGITAPIPMKTDVEWTRESLKVDDLTIRFHRTLRVPDAGGTSELPPDLGTFPFFPVDQLGARVPEETKKRGGFITPMFRREALWISLDSKIKKTSRQSVYRCIDVDKGVNVVSGASTTNPSPLNRELQDYYVVAGRQPWIDGISTGEGTVRQFVVTEMHKGFTVEEQDKFTKKSTILAFGPSAGGTLVNGLCLVSHREEECHKQELYRDTESVRTYNQQLARRFHIHIIAPELWEELTGVLPPVTPVTREMYTRHSVPWYKLFDDYAESIAEISKDLTSVRSVSALDKASANVSYKAEGPVIDPDAPPPCFQHRRSVSSCVFRPCGHAACADCIGPALLRGCLCSCGIKIARFVGTRRAFPLINMMAQEPENESDDGMHHWRAEEIEKLSMHAVLHGRVVVIHRPEDRVAPLQQQNPRPVHPLSGHDGPSHSTWS
ncbi:hypothetical protein FA13DRAFT_1816431 [Coprinellus micaceus]|uniref:RING-type domain-containing protein n=1 Tax=Coprinellus micaceus TaxID=71717 RepID=A0A4Y7T186_COPMI|nr:hypothetical protein FA13DRAFT_1816431 [Coprinellus micaceus]